MLPIEFIFNGPPLSLQSKNKAKKRNYKAMVANEAASILPAGFTPTAPLLPRDCIVWQER